MDSQGVERTLGTTKSFRNEDYNNRRAFLRSYPLHRADEDIEVNNNNKGAFLRSYPLHRADEDREVNNEATTEVIRKRRKPMKRIVVAVLEWKGEKILVFRRLKHKVKLYVITCLPVGFNGSTGFLSI